MQPCNLTCPRVLGVRMQAPGEAVTLPTTPVMRTFIFEFGQHTVCLLVCWFVCGAQCFYALDVWVCVVFKEDVTL